MIEGLDNNIEQDNNLTAIVLPADAIAAGRREHHGVRSRIRVAQARAAVNVIMKSGSNAFHGSLFEYHNDSDLQARNFFSIRHQRSARRAQPVRRLGRRPYQAG